MLNEKEDVPMRLNYSIRYNCLRILWGDHLLASFNRLLKDHYGYCCVSLSHINRLYNVCFDILKHNKAHLKCISFLKLLVRSNTRP